MLCRTARTWTPLVHVQCTMYGTAGSLAFALLLFEVMCKALCSENSLAWSFDVKCSCCVRISPVCVCTVVSTSANGQFPSRRGRRRTWGGGMGVFCWPEFRCKSHASSIGFFWAGLLDSYCSSCRIDITIFLQRWKIQLTISQNFLTFQASELLLLKQPLHQIVVP